MLTAERHARIVEMVARQGTVTVRSSPPRSTSPSPPSAATSTNSIRPTAW